MVGTVAIFFSHFVPCVFNFFKKCPKGPWDTPWDKRWDSFPFFNVSHGTEHGPTHVSHACPMGQKMGQLFIFYVSHGPKDGPTNLSHGSSHGTSDCPTDRPMGQRVKAWDILWDSYIL